MTHDSRDTRSGGTPDARYVRVVGPHYIFNDEEAKDPQGLGLQRSKEFTDNYDVGVGTDGIAWVKRRAGVFSGVAPESRFSAPEDVAYLLAQNARLRAALEACERVMISAAKSHYTGFDEYHEALNEAAAALREEGPT